MASVPQYAATPRVGMAQISAANPNRDGTGPMETVFAAGASGSRIDLVVVKAVGTTTAGMVRLFVGDGTTTRLLTEIPVFPVTASATAETFEDGRRLEIALPSGYALKASTEKAETLNVMAFGGDF